MGFAIYSVLVPTDKESEDGIIENAAWILKCELTIEDRDQFSIVAPLLCKSLCYCGADDDVPNQVWVTYYPKIIIPSEYVNNKTRVFLKAAFQGSLFGQPVKVEKCGIHLIYAHEQESSDEPCLP